MVRCIMKCAVPFQVLNLDSMSLSDFIHVPPHKTFPRFGVVKVEPLGIFTALFALVGLGLFVPVLAEFFATGLVPRFPTLIVSTVLFVCALLLLVCGFVLDTVAKKHRQLFEINLNILRLLKDKGE